MEIKTKLCLEGVPCSGPEIQISKLISQNVGNFGFILKLFRSMVPNTSVFKDKKTNIMEGSRPVRCSMECWQRSRVEEYRLHLNL